MVINHDGECLSYECIQISSHECVGLSMDAIKAAVCSDINVYTGVRPCMNARR